MPKKQISQVELEDIQRVHEALETPIAVTLPLRHWIALTNFFKTDDVDEAYNGLDNDTIPCFIAATDEGIERTKARLDAEDRAKN